MRWLGSAALLSVMACSAADARPDLLLITMDTTRADALGAYGATPSPSPNLDALAASGLRIDEAMTVAPLTLPAHTSMLSGVAPDIHGVRDNGQRVPADLATLPQLLQASDWHTGAVVSAVVLDGGLGLDRGFDTYQDGFDFTRLEGLHDPGATRVAEQAANQALEWLEQQEDGPIFLWVHFYDPHQPLRAPAPFSEAFPDAYAAEIAYADHHAGRIIDAVKARKRPHMVIVAGDHGEGHGEHGESTHGQFVYRSTMRVPLIAAGTGIQPEVRPGPASVVDVAATLLDAAGLPAMPESDGLSLLKGAGSDAERRVYGESFHQRNALGLAELHVWQDGRFRHIVAPRPELYEWRTDPVENRDLIQEPPAPSRSLVADFEPWMQGRRGRASTPAQLDPATREALRRLGYVQGAPLDDAGPLPDPKDHADLQARVDSLTTLARTRPPAEALPLLRDFCAQYPRIRSPRLLLSRALQLTGAYAEAVEVDRSLLSETPRDASILAHIGELYQLMGEVEAAAEHLRRASEMDPENAAIAAVRGEMLRRDRRCDEALRLVDAALARNEQATRTRLVRGACLWEVGRITDAAADLERVLAEDPASGDVRYLLGVVRLAQGRHDEAVRLLQEQVQRTPEVTQAHSALGLALLAIGRHNEAIVSLRLAAPDPNTGVDAPLALAGALLDLDGDDAEITRWLDEAARRSPGDPRVLERRSSHLLHLGRTEQALELMVEARRSRDRARSGTQPSKTP